MFLCSLWAEPWCRPTVVTFLQILAAIFFWILSRKKTEWSLAWGGFEISISELCKNNCMTNSTKKCLTNFKNAFFWKMGPDYIELGRYNNPITPINQRICTRCELNEIDDEIHLLLHCNSMNNERKILFNSVTATINIQPTNEMFLQIMTSRDITVVKSLAQFIYGCFKQINC